MLQMRQAVVVDAHRTGGTRLRSADVLLRILRSQRDRHREHLKTLPASAECVLPSASRGIVVRGNLKGEWPALIAPTHGDAAPMRLVARLGGVSNRLPLPSTATRPFFVASAGRELTSLRTGRRSTMCVDCARDHRIE